MLRAINLKTEYLYNPMGLDIEKPRLFWNADGKGMQKAYEIEYLLNDTLPVRLPIMKSGSMRTVFTPELKSRDRVAGESGLQMKIEKLVNGVNGHHLKLDF